MKLTLYLFTFMMCFAINQIRAETYDHPKRVLRRGGGEEDGGRSSSSSGRSSSRGSSSSYYKSTYKPASTELTKNTKVSYYNQYFNSKAGRTYEPLTTYYLAPNYYSSKGFYSPVYLKIYYNGYGYNFYYNQYGYY